MIQQASEPLADLYEADETAWLEAMAGLIAEGRLEELDYEHLREYLTDMVLRDRRAVTNRLVALILHLLKWTHQPERRTKSWHRTILVQRNHLVDLASKGVLRQHAESVLPTAYERAVELASVETGLPVETFPKACPLYGRAIARGRQTGRAGCHTPG